MKILIDATGITRQKAGVGVYAKNLIDKLTLAAPRLDLHILAQNDDPEMDFSTRPNVTMVWVPAILFRKLPLRFLLEQLYLPCLLLLRRIDVIHSLHYAFPLLPVGTRRVVTIHDMTFFTMPEVHEKIKILYFRFFMRAAVRLADAIVFISQSVQKDCIALLGATSGIHTVIPHGKDESLQPATPSPAYDADLKCLGEKYRLPQHFVLYIGTLEPRKNLDRLILAFSEIAARDPEIGLVLAGKMGWMMESLSSTIERLGLTARVVFTGFILEEEKPLLLSACAVFVYPSLYEGFGLPVLEALACGAPTITSNISSLPEVAGDAAILIDPLNSAAIAAAMNSLLTNPALRSELRAKGFSQASKFTWQKTASLTAEVYSGVNANPSEPVE
jgi:glycosyltransferase involved in cell wall biosynthesis